MTLTVDSLIEYAHLLPSSNMNIYQTGSRVYGTNAPDSDFDFYIIISDSYFEELDTLYKTRKIQKAPREDLYPFDGQWTEFKYEDHQVDAFSDSYKCLYIDVPNISININLYKQTTFESKVEANWLQALMVVFLPTKHVWRSDISSLAPQNVSIYYPRLVVSIIGEANKHYDMAKRRWTKTKDDHRSEKKYIVHAFRDFLLGLQLTNYGRMNDYTCANDFYYEIMNYDSHDWNFYDKKYFPKFEEYNNQVDALFREKMRLDDKLEDQSNTVSFLNTYNGSLEILRKYLCLDVKDCGDGLFQIFATDDSPHNSPVVIESGNGMIVYESRIVSLPPPLILLYSDHYAKKLDYKTEEARICVQKVDTTMVTLYYWNEKWNLSTSEKDPNRLVMYNEVEMTIPELFWRLFETWKRPDAPDLCFTFVMDLELRTMGLFAVMDRVHMKDLPCKEFIDKYNWNEYNSDPCSSIYTSETTIKAIDEAITYACTLDPCNAIGVWVIDSKRQRVSVPSIQRQSLLSLVEKQSRATERYLVDVIRSVHPDPRMLQNLNEWIQTNNPQLVPLFEQTLSKYTAMCNILDSEFTRMNTTTKDTKEFVDQVKQYSNTPIMITIMTQQRNGKHHVPIHTKDNNISTLFALSNNERVSLKIFNSVSIK